MCCREPIVSKQACRRLAGFQTSLVGDAVAVAVAAADQGGHRQLDAAGSRGSRQAFAAAGGRRVPLLVDTATSRSSITGTSSATSASSASACTTSTTPAAAADGGHDGVHQLLAPDGLGEEGC